MIVWLGLIAAVALLLAVGIERIMRRLGIQPDRPDDATGGVRDILDRVEQWQRDYADRRKRR